MIPETLLFGLCGLVVGSFLNVVILRHGVRSLGGRSACMSCGVQLRWFEMIPVLSWIALCGRCRVCHTAISMQYPLVELATGALFALIGGASIDVFIKILYLCIASLLVIIFVYDLYHTIIPDEWVYTFAAFSFVSALVLLFPLLTFDVLLLTIMAGPITAFPLFALWFISRGRWMGLGDPKLALGIGWLLGVPYGLSAVFLAFVIGGVVSVCILLPFQYIVHITSEIPPVPFVAVLQFGRRMSSLAKMMYKNDPRQWKEYLRKIRQQQGQRITHLGPARTGFTMKSEVPFGPFLIASCCLIWFAMMYGVRIPFIL